MANREPAKSWWQTLPGIITGVTALITAVAGLVVAINQTGWFARSTASAARDSGAPASISSDGAAATAASAPSSPGSGAPAAEQPSAAAQGIREITLPALRTHRMAGAAFTLLGATLSPRNSETDTLAIRVRMLNEGSYPTNFWDDEFRLLVDGVPRAPDSGLNELVAAESALDGEVTFAVPRAAADVQLRILFGDERSDVPLNLAVPGR